MWEDVITSLITSVITVFLVMVVLSGFNFISSLINLMTIIMIVIDMMGMMYWWGIDLNAVSLVNLVMVSFLEIKK